MLSSPVPDRPGAAARRPAADVLFWDPVHAWRRLLAELVGTLLLTFVAACPSGWWVAACLAPT